MLEVQSDGIKTVVENSGYRKAGSYVRRFVAAFLAVLAALIVRPGVAAAGAASAASADSTGTITSTMTATATAGGSNDAPGRKTRVDGPLYFFGAGMTGEVGAGNATADLDLGFDEILDHLEFGAMGFLRVRRDPWSVTAEASYMGLGASKDAVSADMDQLLVETRVAYRAARSFEPLVGVRYVNVSGEIAGPFGRNPTDTQDWWDPILGGTFTVPLGRKLDLVAHGDAGGFDIGSKLTWQLYPYLDWNLGMASLQAGYRWLDMEYETGSGQERFRYDVLTQGPQIGVTVPGGTR